MKTATSKWLKAVGMLLPFRWLNRVARGRLMTPFYHTVSDAPLPHIRQLYQVKTVAAFEKDLDFLLKYYTPVDIFQFKQWWESPEKWVGKPPMLLSFDDGLREFYDPVAPLLVRKGIPAVCFLNSAFLDNADLFFRYKASLLADHLRRENREKEAQEALSVSYADRAVLDARAVECGVDFSAFLEREQPYLTTLQVEELMQKGFYFGAHSVDHPEYRYLELEEQLRQTAQSTEFISNRFGLGYRLFSFPFTDAGVSRRFFETVLSEKKIADFTFGCAGIKNDVHPRHFQRIPMERGDWDAEAVMRYELLYYRLKSPLGKNQVHRS